MASLQRFVPATCPMKFNKLNFVRHVAGTDIPQNGVAKVKKCQFTRGDMSLQHIPGTCSRNIFMCVQMLCFCPCYMSPHNLLSECNAMRNDHCAATRMHCALVVPHKTRRANCQRSSFRLAIFDIHDLNLNEHCA